MKNIKVSRYRSSLKDIKSINVISAEMIKEKESRGFSSGSAVGIEKAQTEIGEVYIVTAMFWGFDDVDENVHAFANLKDAGFCYSEYLNPVPAEDSGILARITRPDHPVKYIPAINFKGFFCGEKYGGDWIVPYFNQKKLQELGLLDEVKKHNETDLRDLIGTKFEPALLKWGMNEYEVYIQDDAAYRSEIIAIEKVVHFCKRNCWETGLNYYQLQGRYPADVFAAMKPHLRYHSEEIEEEGDWKGWYTMAPDAMNIELNKIGWSCK